MWLFFSVENGRAPRFTTRMRIWKAPSFTKNVMLICPYIDFNSTTLLTLAWVRMNSIIEDTFAKYAEWVPVNKPRTHYPCCGTCNADLTGKLSTSWYLCLRFDPLINRKHGIRRFKSNCLFFSVSDLRTSREGRGYWSYWFLTHWGRVTHICVSKLAIIAWDNGLSPGRRQAIIWTNAGILLIRPKLQWNLNRNLYTFIQENAFENVVWKWRPFCLGLNVLKLLMCTDSDHMYGAKP